MLSHRHRIPGSSVKCGEGDGCRAGGGGRKCMKSDVKSYRNRVSIASLSGFVQLASTLRLGKGSGWEQRGIPIESP